MANGSRLAAWEFFGAELRRRREEMGLSQAQLGALVFVSGAYIGQFEHAIRKPQMELAIRFDEILQTDGIFERLCLGLINDRRYADYFAKAAELEALATKICEFAPALVPGLLQTEEYARAVTVATNPLSAEEYIEDKVDGRMDRSRILKDATRPLYWAILHENSLRVPVGGSAAMARQLDHITALMRERTVLVQVLPYSAGAYSVMTGSLKLMEFDDAPPTAYTEAVYSGNLLDDPAVVKHAYAAYDLLRAAALSPEVSLTLIESAAEDHRRCASTT
ncbi:helix-turn-helix domain-containing protein [Streptomyces sp. NPDC001100]